MMTIKTTVVLVMKNEDSLEDENGVEDSQRSDMLYKSKEWNKIQEKKKYLKYKDYVRYNKKNDLEKYCREQLMFLFHGKMNRKICWHLLTHLRPIIKHQFNLKVVSMSTTLKYLSLQDK